MLGRTSNKNYILKLNKVIMNKVFQKLLIIWPLLLLTVTLYAQTDVTNFLDIPVDGYKSEMVKKLKDKGYTISTQNKDILIGEFNGTKVNIHIVTNNNKVCRIMVSDATEMDEANIKIRFNRLCEQFKNNKNYSQLVVTDFTISEDEDISYMMTVKNKQYDALFYQKPNLDSAIMAKELEHYILKKYTKEQLSSFTEKETEDIFINYYSDKLTKKAVWFRINEIYGKYYITMYYDNEYNRANGEDL